jgi:hypothetical protein
MDKIAAYDLLLSEHPLWTKEAIFLDLPHYLGVMLPAAAATGALTGAASTLVAPSDASDDRKNPLKGALRGAAASPIGFGLGVLASMAAHKKGMELNGLLTPLIGAAATGSLAAMYARNKKESNKN